MTTATQADRSPHIRPTCNPRQGPDVTRAYGFILDRECISRWTAICHERRTGVKPSSLSPEEEQEIIRSGFPVTLNWMAGIVYIKVPSIPRLSRRIILMSGAARRYLFVLRDNSSFEARNAPVYPDDIEAVKTLLELKDDPGWYDVSI